MSATTEQELLASLQRDGVKPRLVIARTSCMCGGRWAWLLNRPERADVMLGCVCHHWWTPALRATAVEAL